MVKKLILRYQISWRSVQWLLNYRQTGQNSDSDVLPPGIQTQLKGILVKYSTPQGLGCT